MLPDQWSLPPPVTELRVPDSDATALSTLASQHRQVGNQLVHTSCLLGVALIPIIRYVDERAHSQIPPFLGLCTDITGSLSTLLV